LSLSSQIAFFKGIATSMSISKLDDDPSIWTSEPLELNGTIVNFLQDSSGLTTAMNVADPNDPGSVVYVQLSAWADVTQMNKGDSVTIWATGEGVVSGQNDFGGSINEAAFQEDYMTDTTTGYQDDSDPNP
jgi:hypothetical protein